jgi:EAL and modified HD-GYP domain-containing signal transduction protein
MLVEDLVQILPAHRVGVEILENIEPDMEVIRACRRLKEQGYTLVLDDFILNSSTQAFLEVADIIKIDFLQSVGKERSWFVGKVDPRKTLMLAEKVETHEALQEAINLGYSYFQGYFFAKPEVMSGKQIPPHKIHYLQFLKEINRPEFDFKRLESIVKQEVSLSVRLLRYLNSAAVGMHQRVSSIRQALVLLGEKSLRRWAHVVIMAGLGEQKPSELLTTCLIRARFCEMLGQAAKLSGENADLFLVGMLSGIEAIVEKPLDEIFEMLAIAENVQAALHHEGSPMGRIFDLVLAYEQGAWERIPKLAEGLRIENTQIPTIYRESVIWAEQAIPR